MPLTGSALVTGATSDIGAAIALALADAGLSVGVHFHRREDRARELVGQLEERGVKAVAVRADVADHNDARALTDRTVERLGPLWALVNAAADVRFARFLESDPATWRQQVDVSLHGVLNCSHAAAQHMVGVGAGRIVNVVAEGALVGEPALSVASAAKAGVVGFTRSLARELAPAGVTVNAVSPGFIPTDAVPEAMRTPERLQRIAARYPARRLGTPQDIAEVVAFLCSDAAGYVMGQTISVSGAYSMR